MKQKVEKLAKLCRGAFDIHVNPHHKETVSVEEYMTLDNHASKVKDIIDRRVYGEMIKSDTIMCVMYRPSALSGYRVAYHYNLEKAMDEAIQIMEQVEVC